MKLLKQLDMFSQKLDGEEKLYRVQYEKRLNVTGYYNNGQFVHQFKWLEETKIVKTTPMTLERAVSFSNFLKEFCRAYCGWYRIAPVENFEERECNTYYNEIPEEEHQLKLFLNHAS